jgi:acetyl-CoA carboxylase biotin carboxyl carrier protein
MAGPKKPAAKEDLTVNLREITEIVNLMAKNDLTLFHWERGGVKLELRRGADMEAMKDLMARLPAPVAAPPASFAPPAHFSPAPAVSATSSAAPAAEATAAIGPVVNSPMVGTFYRSSAPGEKPFINVGDSVDENTVVCIIEAMKVMNEIKAEMRGTVAKVLVEDGKPVQYGQPLFELRA